MKVNKTSPSCKGPMNEIDVDVSNGKLATENKPSSYISIQTGEEFSSEFLERLTPRAAPCEPLIAQNHGTISQNHNCQTGYEDLARVFGLRQVDSKSVANLLDFGYLTNFSSEVENHAPMSMTERFYTFGASNGHASNNIPLSSESYLSFEQENASQLGKLRILCSFGGKILPRPTYGKLRYVGGETRIISVKKNLSWQELLNKTSGFCNQPHSIKYQLPGEDLDALISVSSDEDLENMKEEYNGLEGVSGFQRLRIFLIPNVESERQPTFEIASIQQSNPDYEYVYALNGMRDPSPRKNFAEPTLNKVSVSMRKLDSIPSFHEGLLLRRREMNDCPSTSHPMHALQESPSSFWSPLSSHAHSSRLAQQGNLRSGLTQWSKDKSHYDNIGGNDTFRGQRFYDKSLHNPNLQGNKLQFEAPTTKCSNIHVDHSRSSVVRHENRTPHHERSMSQIDDRSWILEYTKTIGSHQGMTHAFSDSQLQQHGEMYDYRSQEGIWDKQLRRRDDFVDAEVPKKMFEVDNLDAFDSVQLTTKNQHFKIGANSLEKSQTTNDLEKVILVRQESHESNPSSIKRMNVISISPLHQQVPNLDELDIPYIGHNLDNGKVKYVAHEALVEPSPTVKPIGSILPSVSCTQNHHHMFSEDLLQSQENVEMQQYNLNPEALVKHVGNGQKIQGQISQFDQLSGLPRDLILHIPDGRLPVGYQRDEVTHETIIRYPVPCPPFACNIDNVESSLQKDEYCNMRPTQHKESFLSNGRVACFLGDKAQNVRVGNVDDNSTKTCMPNQMDALHKHNGHNQLDPLNDIQEATNCMSNEVGCSSLTVPRMVEEIVIEPQSPTTIVGEGVDSKRDSEDVDPNKKQKNDTMREVVMAEMEADSYGLQIIKNDDLEDLWEIGSGTYGTVFHGKWRGTDVAIKRIKKNYFLGRSSEQERLTKDFWREAQILSQLHHPNVVAFYGVVPDGAGGTLATVTEFMVNGSLRNALVKKDRPLDRHKKLMVVLDAAIGMEYLHSRNIVHFDLKCDNLLLNLKDPQRPICKVGDFGLSRIKCNTLVSGGVRGTLPWMAPELLNGSSVRVSEKVDVFSFGIVMWEILTGEEPYVDMHYGAIIGGIIKDTLRPPVPENCDPEWKKLMGECWSSDPNSRPTFTEVAIKLRSMSISLHSKGHRPQIIGLGEQQHA